jgi:formamidopyrimidine-DNA glycosylase
MPELPEVQTTVAGLQKVLPKLTITSVWSDLASKNQTIPQFKETLKDAAFFTKFKKEVTGAKIVSVERRAKNILINLATGKTILVHMKMTGHFLYGKYAFNAKQKIWVAAETGPLQDPFNKWLHFILTLSNGKHLALSDMRKFAKITLLSTKDARDSKHLADLGPEPLEKKFTFKIFVGQLGKRETGRIKTVLMDQRLISGIGNIYSDEALWLASINPEERVHNIPEEKLKKLYTSILAVLEKGIDFKGYSTSDYRNIDGKPGEFSHQHNAYRKTGDRCGKPGCKGGILRKVVGGRSAHFCSVHQKLINTH